MSNQAIVDNIKETEEKRIQELTNTLRLTNNAVNLILEAKFPGTHAEVVIQTVRWLQAVAKDIERQLLPPEATKPTTSTAVA